LSPSLVYGAIELIDVIKRNPANSEEAILSLTLCPFPSNEIIEITKEINWLTNSNRFCLKLSELGESAFSQSEMRAKQRQFINDYINAKNPSWALLAYRGRKHMLLHAPKSVKQVFYEADLIDSDESDVVAFWDFHSFRSRNIDDMAKIKIGREGEKRTIQYELNRTGMPPKWAALEDNDLGYDVLSRVSQKEPNKLTIEVKATKRGLLGSFFLTRNEWSIAQNSLNHKFHLWDLGDKSYRIAVLEADRIAEHVPVNSGVGTWQKVKIPFNVFANDFSQFE